MRYTPIAALLFLILLILPQQLRALAPPAVPGWTHISGSSKGGTTAGAVAPGSGAIYSSPVVAEIDGQSADGPEVAVAAADGNVSVFHANGALLWSAKTPNASCGRSNDRVFSSPAVGELFNNGLPYLVIGYGGFNTTCDGGVIAYRGDNGARAWNLSLSRFGRSAHFGSRLHAVYGTPALSDVDGDGRLEIGFGSFDRNVYLLNASGSVRWYYNAADTVFSSPAFFNVDRDRNLEMIIGTDISQNNHLRPPTKNGGYVYALKTNPVTRSRHLGFRQRGAFRWSHFINQVVQSSPTIAEVLASNPGPEIIIGSGCFFPQSRAAKNGKFLEILRIGDGRKLKSLNAPGCLTSVPAVGDIDGDGISEIVASVNGAKQYGGDGVGRIVAWKATSPNPIWMSAPHTSGYNDPYQGNLQSPVLADLDGNGSLEVIASNGTGVVVLNGRTGAQLTCPQGSCNNTEVAMITGAVLKSTPAIADINRDGIPDILAAGRSGNSTVLYAWTNLNRYISSGPGPYRRFAAPWPMFKGNSYRNGVQGGS